MRRTWIWSSNNGLLSDPFDISDPCLRLHASPAEALTGGLLRLPVDPHRPLPGPAREAGGAQEQRAVCRGHSTNVGSSVSKGYTPVYSRTKELSWISGNRQTPSPRNEKHVVYACDPRLAPSLFLPARYWAAHRCFSMHAGAFGGIFHRFSLIIFVSTALFIQKANFSLVSH